VKPRFILFYDAVERDGSVRRKALLPPQMSRSACRRLAFGSQSKWMWESADQQVRNFRIARVLSGHPKYGAWVEDPPYPYRKWL